MPRKPSKPRKNKKVETVDMPKPETPVSVESILSSLSALQSSAGWALVKKILNDNIAYLEKAILEKIDPATRTRLSDEDIEVLRIKRSLNIDLRDTPENYAKVIQAKKVVEDNFDPYFKTSEEIEKANKK